MNFALRGGAGLTPLPGRFDPLRGGRHHRSVEEPVQEGGVSISARRQGVFRSQTDSRGSHRAKRGTQIASISTFSTHTGLFVLLCQYLRLFL